jgi:hypothetical protein
MVRRAIATAGIVLSLISAIPGYFGTTLISPTADGNVFVLGVLLFVLSASTLAAGLHLIALGLRAKSSEELRRSWGRSVSAYLGIALILGGWFLLLCLAEIWTPSPGAVLVRAFYFILGIASCTTGTISLGRFLKARLPEVSSEVILLPEVDEDLPVVAPEPNLAGLLQTKKRLKDQGRT